MSTNMKQWIQGLATSNKRQALPIMTHPGIEVIGKTVLDAVTDGEVHFQAIKAVNDKYPQSAAATVIMDLTVEAEAFGCEIVFPQDEVPSVIGRLVSDHASVEALAIPSLQAGRLPEYLKANKLAVENITNKPVLAGCIGPFSLAGRLYDMTEIMMACYTEPETATLLLQKCTDFLISYCKELKRIGVNGVVLAEPAAGLLSNDGCQEFSSDYVKQIVDAVQDDNFVVVLHNCGNTGHCTQAMVNTGAAALHFGNKINMVDVLNEVPAHIPAMGNIDPVSLFKQATAKEMYDTVEQLLNATKTFPNFVLSSGCDTPPEVPASNIDAFYAALDAYNA